MASSEIFFKFDFSAMTDAFKKLAKQLEDDLDPANQAPTQSMIGLSAWLTGQGLPAGPSWHMPDGSKTTTRPKDGEKIYTLNTDSSVTTWMWDDLLESWHNVSTGKPNQYNTVTHNISHGIQSTPIKVTISSGPKKCECGAHACGSNKHYAWCDLFDPEQ